MANRIPCLLVTAAVLAPSGLAFGKPSAGVPTRAIACVPDTAKLVASGDDPAVCWDTGCMKLDMSSGDATAVPRPRAQPSWRSPSARVEDAKVCFGTKCRPIKRRLAAAIAASKKDEPSLAVHATTDLKAVVFGAHAWNVAADRPLKLKAPPSYRRVKGDTPQIVDIQVAGTLLVVEWSACAGPCTTMILADSAGRNRGKEGTGGGPMFQLDAKRFVVLSEYNLAQIYELGSGRARGSVAACPYQNPEGSTQAVRLDDMSFAVAYSHHGGLEVVTVSAVDDRTLEPHVSQTVYLPSCTVH